MDKKIGLDDLLVYQLAMELGDKIWDMVNKWEKFEKWSIGNQICRSGDSVAANIAEGFGRYHFNDNRNFCFYARGSLMETKSWLQKAKSRNLINDKEYHELYQLLTRCHYILNQYIKSIGKTENPNVKEPSELYIVKHNPELEDFTLSDPL